jgi:hypothetical protein
VLYGSVTVKVPPTGIANGFVLPKGDPKLLCIFISSKE